MTNKELLEVIAAEEAGKKIEYRSKSPDGEWGPKLLGGWNTDVFSYRIASEPAPKQGRWVRKEIRQHIQEYVCDLGLDELPQTIDTLQRIPGFGGIDYRSPFDPKIIVRSTVPVMFEETGGWATFDFAGHFRPGIPVAAWFWRES